LILYDVSDVKPLILVPIDRRIAVPKATRVGEGFRGVEGRLGYLLVQAERAFGAAMEAAVQAAGGLSRAQFGTLSVVVREPGLSAADLARAVMVTPQAINLLVNGLERDGLVERRPHPTHGRILEIHPTREGVRRLDATYPAVIELEARIADGLSPRKLADVKKWLVDTATALSAPSAIPKAR
jgi:DNA-binding MarR family transcriptional regulator